MVFGVNASPFILNPTIRHHVSTCIPDDSTHKELLKSFYFDDYGPGVSDRNNASALSKEIKLWLKSGGFNMRKWSSNSESLMTLSKIQLSVETLLRLVEKDQKDPSCSIISETKHPPRNCCQTLLHLD